MQATLYILLTFISSHRNGKLYPDFLVNEKTSLIQNLGLVSGESGDYPSFKVWTWVVRVVPGQLTPPSNNSHLKNSPGTNHTLTISTLELTL